MTTLLAHSRIKLRAINKGRWHVLNMHNISRIYQPTPLEPNALRDFSLS